MISSSAIKAVCIAAGLVACGCAHNKANQYAYAPPLMPPVYPQAQTVAQPGAYPAGAIPGPLIAAPVGAPMAAPVYQPAAAAAPPMAGGGVVPALADGSCPPRNAGCDGAVPVAYEGGMQTVPCPPGS